jgi:hypothetical protein
MSVFLDKADLIAARLNSVAGLESYVFIVARPKKLAVELEKLLNKATGGGVVIWKGGPNEKEESTARITSRYSVVLAENPLLRSREAPAQDEIAQLVISALHAFPIDDGPNAFRTRIKLVTITPSEEVAGMELIFESITQLPKTTIILLP